MKSLYEQSWTILQTATQSVAETVTRHGTSSSQDLYSRLHIITRDIFICRSGQAFVCLRKCCWVPEGRQRDTEKARPLYLTLRHPSPSRCSRHAATLPLLPAIIALNTIFYFVHAPLDLTSCWSRNFRRKQDNWKIKYFSFTFTSSFQQALGSLY